MRNGAAIILLACLGGCAKPSLQEVVKQRLSDPAAEIRNVTYSDPGNYACVEARVKNGGGAPKRIEAYYQKSQGKWSHVYDYPETHDECVELINTIDRAPAQRQG